MNSFDLVLAYVGPDTILPLTSTLAAVLGVLLMFWHYVLRVVQWPFQQLFGSKATTRTNTTSGAIQGTESAGDCPAAVGVGE